VVNTYVQGDGRVVWVGDDGRAVRYLADGETLDPRPIEIPDRPSAPRKPKPNRTFVGSQDLIGASPARPGQGCMPNGSGEVCGACAHFLPTRKHMGRCALFSLRMTKFRGKPPEFSQHAAAGSDFRTRERLDGR
jgi:hypothetical protein